MTAQTSDCSARSGEERVRLRDAVEEGGATLGDGDRLKVKQGYPDCQASLQENVSEHNGKLRQKFWDGWCEVCRVGAAHNLCPDQSCLGVVSEETLAPGGKDHVISICFSQGSAMPAS